MTKTLPTPSPKVSTLQQAKARRETRQYANLVMDAFDDLTHTDRRAKREAKSQVEQAARNRY